ncbi:tetratricopeptide repeat protein [Variovorax sp. 38R]|uniref:tetratricopeptide repeat protein n=1 Tax=Variovorax sp. 38R TaxID=2774875 RepID=UPI00177C1950|nr:hypothetical protein [Variovorax sp. 38R]QOF81158.1 hypothetical protein IG196_12570 [Variovorax sp. 38R]
MKSAKHLLHILPLLLVLAQPLHAQTATDIIHTDKAGRVLTFGDVNGSFSRLRNAALFQSKPSSKARRLKELGDDASLKKDYETARRHYEASAEASPKWPYPIYRLAEDYLDEGNTAKAYEFHRRVDSLSPRGFLRTLTILPTLQLEMQGKLPRGTAQRLFKLEFEWVGKEKAWKQAAVELTTRYPDFAPGWQEMARVEDDPVKRLQFIEKGLSKDPDPETRGWFLVTRAETLAERGDKATALRMLGDVALDPTSTVETEILAKHTIETMLSKK